MRKLVVHIGDILPVHRAPIAVKQASARKVVSGGADSTDCDTSSNKRLQSFTQVFGVYRMKVDSGANKKDIEWLLTTEGLDGIQGQAIAGTSRGAVKREQGKLVQLRLGIAVGRTQWFDRGGKSHHSEICEQQETVTFNRW